MRVALLLSSIACVVLTVLHAWRENIDAEWTPPQRRYARMLAARPRTEAGENTTRAFQVKMRQVVLPGGYATDRCVSCHVAIEDPQMAAEGQPLRTHPGDYLNVHSVERFGCTICHDGQGLALNFADAAAYTRDRFWEKPLLKAPFVEANCYRCHVDVLAATPTYAFGKQIFDGSGCIGCHMVRGRGGSVGPDLSLIGESSRHIKVPTKEHHDLIEQFAGNETLAYLYESVKWPNAQPSETKMPNFQFTDDEALALVVYLKSLVRPATVVGLVPPAKVAPPPSDVVERGRASYSKYCVGCHGESAGGGIPNVNAGNPVIPPLNLLARRMAFSKATEVDAFLTIVRGLNGAPLERSDAARLANWPQIAATMAATRAVISQGRSVGAVEASGPEPLDMPSWRQLIDAGQVDAIIAYLVTTMPWDDGSATGPSLP